MPPRPTTWSCGGVVLDLWRPLVMGILNVTPDSFSDGGSYRDVDEAVAAGLRMVAEGADIIDVGGESTRPGSDDVPTGLELQRVLPVVAGLAAQGARVSIDTRHARIASAAVDAGAAIVNDVSGFRDPEMVGVAADTTAGLVVMHMLGEPRTMQAEPTYEDVVTEVADYLRYQAEHLEALGVARERIAIDPGIGFGKTTAHNLALLRDLSALTRLPYPIAIGVSRKRFIGEITGVAEPRERLAGSIAAALLAVQQGARIVRVHDVAATVQALAVMRAVETEGELA